MFDSFSASCTKPALCISMHWNVILLTARSIIIIPRTCWEAAAIWTVTVVSICLTFAVVTAALFVHLMSSLIGFHYLGCMAKWVCLSTFHVLVYCCRCWPYSICLGWFGWGGEGSRSWADSQCNLREQFLNMTTLLRPLKYYPAVVFMFSCWYFICTTDRLNRCFVGLE